MSSVYLNDRLTGAMALSMYSHIQQLVTYA